MNKTLNILIVLALLNMIGGGLLWYGYAHMQNMKDSESALLTELSGENLKGQKMVALRQTLASAEKERETLEKFLIDPSEENQIKLISQIEKLGTTTGAFIDTTSFDRTASVPPSLHGNFSIRGKWGELYHFLRLIESYPSRVFIGSYDAHIEHEAQKQTLGSSDADVWVGTISIDLISLKPDRS